MTDLPTDRSALGRTGLTVSKIGLGLAALGRPGYINLGHGEDLAQDFVVEAMERRTHRLLDVAYEGGVRYFDAARSYGRAERFLGSWLAERNYHDVVVGSKWGYVYTAEWKVDAGQHEVKSHTLQTLERQWEESVRLLPDLRLYQIHSATFASGVLENEEVLRYLAGIRDKGVRIGLTLSGRDQADVLEAAMLVRVDGKHLFDTVQATYNILEQSCGEVLARAAEAGMGVIVKEALANGRLTTRNQRAQFRERKEILDAMANRYEVGMDALAMAFVLQQPWAHIVLSGAAVESHLRSNLQAATIDIAPEDLEHLRNLQMDVVEYWAERSALPWN